MRWIYCVSWSSRFPQKACVNTERVPAGYPITLLKSNKFNMAAVSVKRSIDKAKILYSGYQARNKEDEKRTFLSPKWAMRTCWSKRETWSQISFDNSSLSNLLCCRKHKSFHLDTDEHRLTLLSIKRLFLLFLIPLAPFSSVFSQGVPFFNGRYTKELHFLSKLE